MRSQFGEDDYIIQKFFPQQREGIYFEAGAMDGHLYSNTIQLSQRGFTGFLVEPNPHEFKKLEKNRPKDRLYHCSIGPVGKDHLALNLMASMSSTSMGQGMGGYTTNVVEVDRRPLTDILGNVEKIDFFSLDVEGAELSVLNTMNWNIPVMVWLIENHEGGKDFHRIRDLMKTHGYLFLERVHFNDVYVHPQFSYDSTVQYVFKDHSFDGTLLLAASVLPFVLWIGIICAIVGGVVFFVRSRKKS
jgi:FkbM family methyltransferase